MLSCEDFVPITHKTYGVAGCYGCERAILNIDFVTCFKGHWCTLMIVPIMDNDSDSFSCSEHKPEVIDGISFCTICSLWDSKRKRCKLGKEVKELVVRFD